MTEHNTKRLTDLHVFLVSVLHFIYLLLELLLLLLFSPYFFINQSFRLVFTHPCCYDNDRNATFNLMSFIPAASLT